MYQYLIPYLFLFNKILNCQDICYLLKENEEKKSYRRKEKLNVE